MSRPVDAAADFVATRADDLEEVTVESLDTDAGDGSDVLHTAAGVRAIAGPERQTEAAVGSGGVGVTTRSFTLVAGDLVEAAASFGVKRRDRITRPDGTKWITGDTTLGGFDGLYACPDCVKER